MLAVAGLQLGRIYLYKFKDCLLVLAWRWTLPTCSFWPGAGPYSYKFKDCLLVLAWRWALYLTCCSGLEAVHLLAVSEKEEEDEEAKQVNFCHMLYLSIYLTWLPEA